MTETLPSVVPAAPEPAEPAVFTSLDPATGEVVGTFPVHTAADVAEAVAQARQAASWWWDLGWKGRKQHLLRWAGQIARRQEDLVTVIRTENGKPRDDAFAEVFLALEHIRWAAGHAEGELAPQRVSPGMLMFNHSAAVEYRPYGVVGVIGPWNYPVYTPMGSIAYALAAGNTVVFKPSEYTPAIGVWLAGSFAEANPDAPAGVFSVVTGFGATGAALCRAGVDKVAFTGSPATGRKIMAACAETLTPVAMECGGKDALIVADDADVKAAAEAAVWGAFVNGGQTCVGVERVYVTEAVRDAFLAEVRRQVERVRPGSDGKASYGPMTMPGQIEVVRRHVTDALARGGTPLVGGLDSIGERYVSPIVLLDVPEDAPAAREETFGPTLTVRTVADIDEAIALANSSDYALGSAVFSRRQGLSIARRLRAGMTAVNAVLTFGAVPALPLGGGGGESGFGRIHGAHGLREFTRPKAITQRRFTVPFAELTTFNRRPQVLDLVRRATVIWYGRYR